MKRLVVFCWDLFINTLVMSVVLGVVGLVLWCTYMALRDAEAWVRWGIAAYFALLAIPYIDKRINRWRKP